MGAFAGSSPLTDGTQFAAQAIKLGSEAIAGICTAVEVWAKEVGKPKRTDLLNLRLELDEQIVVRLVYH